MRIHCSKLTTCGATINRPSRGHLWFRSSACNGMLSSVAKAILWHKFHFHYLFIYIYVCAPPRWYIYFWFIYFFFCCFSLSYGFRFLWQWIGSYCPRIVWHYNCTVSAAARHIFSVINCRVVAARNLLALASSQSHISSVLVIQIPALVA